MGSIASGIELKEEEKDRPPPWQVTTRSVSRRHSTRALPDRVRSDPSSRPWRKENGKKRPPPGTVSCHLTPSVHATSFGIVQEKLAHNLYHLLVAVTLLNRTKGVHARPVFYELVEKYPSPESLATANDEDLVKLIRPLGLQNTRARRCVALGKAWVENPPTGAKRYRRLHYPTIGAGSDTAKDEVLDEKDEREGWEIAHLPTAGPYALDSFRIFHRDELRGLASDWIGTGAARGFEPEWKRVLPLDKELRACVKWMWLREGWVWDAARGNKTKADGKTMEQARRGETAV